MQLPLLPSLTLPEEHDDLDVPNLFKDDNRNVQQTTAFIDATFQTFNLCTSLTLYSDELWYWVKPRSTTWFSEFVVGQYDNKRWLSMFRMTIDVVFSLAEVLRPHIQKKNTRYRYAVPVVVRVACTLFKLTHGVNLTICSELFAVGRSTVSKMLREDVHSINDCFRHEISWPIGQRVLDTRVKFRTLCALPAIVGALDATHFDIAKPRVSPTNYFYYKRGGYSMICQAVVDNDKRFLDLYVGMPGSAHDSRVLRRSCLYHQANAGSLLDEADAVDGFSPFMIADSGYPLLPWFMVPHERGTQLSVVETLFNRKLRKGCAVVENAFAILKHSFRELLGKSELDVCFLPDVVVCCALLHNILLRQSHEDVEDFLRLLHTKGLQEQDPQGSPHFPRRQSTAEDDPNTNRGIQKRFDLGLYLSSRRRTVGS